MVALVSLATVGSLTLATAGEPTATSGTEPKAANRTNQITNSIGMKLSLVPSGEFMMGGEESAESTAATFNDYYGNG